MAAKHLTPSLESEQPRPRPVRTPAPIDWQPTHPVDFDMAARVRFALHAARVYPTRPMTGDMDTVYVANVRATLHALADALDPTDAVAMYRVGRLLCIAPDTAQA